MNSLLNKAIAQERLTPAEGLEILKNVPWTKVVEAADTVRKAKLPGNRVGYTAFRIVNYTNVCEVTCSFCSFCRPAKHPEAYILSLDEIRQKTLEAKRRRPDFSAGWRQQGNSAQLLHRRFENAHARIGRQGARILAS